MTSFIAAGGSGRSTSVIPAGPAASSVATIAFIPHLRLSSPRVLQSSPIQQPRRHDNEPPPPSWTLFDQRRRARSARWRSVRVHAAAAARTHRVDMLHRTPRRAAGAAAGVVAARLSRGRRRRAPLDGRTVPPPPLSVSVVVPARDEEQRLPACLAALAGDRDVAEVLVVDDESADATAVGAAAAGARVLRGAPRPPGWAGKTWALEQGVRATRGEVVAFLDADARPPPGPARAPAAALDGADLVSAGPGFRCPRALERALHASMLATLVYRFGPADADGRQPPPSRAMANGQCLVMRRDGLSAAGGWARVRGSVVEDVALAQRLRADGARLAFVDATALLDVEPYGSARETWHGWGRSLLAAEETTPAWLAADLAVLWLVMALPLPLAILRRRPLDLALLALRLALLGPLRRNYAPRGAGFWLSPLADLPVAARLTWSVLRPGRTWRGRTYRVPRTAPRRGT